MKRVICLVLVLAMLLFAMLAYAEGNGGNYEQLEKGSKGNAVVELQKRLKELGFYSKSLDGDYGNGTKTAVQAFQEYNGLEADGIATPELQAFLFSNDAQGVPVPEMEISAMNLKKRYDYYFARPTFVNHTEHTVDSVTYMVKVYNGSGERIGYQVLSVQDVCRYPNSDDYNLEYATGEVNGIKIKPEGSYSVQSSNEIDFYSFDQDQLSKVLMAVTRYHTTDGENVVITEDEQVWYGNDGTIVTVQYENNIKPIAELTNDIEDEADSFELGIDFLYISNFFAEVADIPVGGCYVNYVYDNGLASNASLKQGDIVVKIGDIWVYDENSVLLAKGLMEEGEETPVVYYRRGERRETGITR